MSNCQSTLKYVRYCATGKLHCMDVQLCSGGKLCECLVHCAVVEAVWWWKIAVQRLQTLRKKQPRRTITKADVEAVNLTLLLRKVSVGFCRDHVIATGCLPCMTGSPKRY